MIMMCWFVTRRRFKNIQPNKPFSEKPIGIWCDIIPSPFVQKWKFEQRGSATKYCGSTDEYGRALVKFFEGKTIYTGHRCSLTILDRDFIKEIVCFLFDIHGAEENAEAINDKVETIMNAKVNPLNQRLFIDEYNFLKLDNRYAFIFNTKTKDRTCDYLLYFCATRAQSLRKMPETKYEKNHENYVAIFDRKKLSDDDFRLLFYIYYRNVKKSFLSLKDIVSFDSALNHTNNNIQYESTKDYCLEYFYKIMHDSLNAFTTFPIRNISYEIDARLSGMYGWPRCYELATQLEMLIAEMYTNGKIDVVNHSEIDLYNLIKDKYPDALFQYHDMWLSNQSLDIFIPSKNIAIEYQGKQHYKAIQFFGGKSNLEDNKRRDNTKRELCKKYGIKLYEWKYDTTINEENVDIFLNGISS